MPQSKNPNFIQWRSSQAKAIVLEDLKNGKLPLNEKKVSAKQAWTVYHELPEFKGVCYKKFKDRLSDHRRAVQKQKSQYEREELAFQHDRIIHPRDETHDRRGKLIFSHHPASNLLCQDLKNGAYPRMTPSELRNSRPEYKLFSLQVFKERIYQEICLKKFCNWYDSKCKKKEEEKQDRDYSFVNELKRKGSSDRQVAKKQDDHQVAKKQVSQRQS